MHRRHCVAALFAAMAISVQFPQNRDNSLIHHAAVLSVAMDERHPYRLSVYVVVFDNTQATIDCTQRKQGKDCVRSNTLRGFSGK